MVIASLINIAASNSKKFSFSRGCPLYAREFEVITGEQLVFSFMNER